MTNKPAQDFASVLRRYYAEFQQPAGVKSKLVLGEKNRKKLERIRERVREIRGGQRG